jgi:hypothetical protein
MNCPIHAASACETAVGCVDDRIDLLLGDVSDCKFEDFALNVALHNHLSDHGVPLPAFQPTPNYTGASPISQVNSLSIQTRV